jgi:TonB family protein
VIRTVWIAHANSIIVRDSWEAENPVTPSVPATASGDPLSRTAPSNGAGVGGEIGGRSSGPTYGPMVKVRPPVAIRKPAAAYTPEARSGHYQGTVLVSVDVDENGRAAAVGLVRGLGMGLDYQAVEAARQWQFTPGTRDGAPAKMTRPYDVEFGSPMAVRGASLGRTIKYNNRTPRTRCRLLCHRSASMSAPKPLRVRTIWHMCRCICILSRRAILPASRR